jgi:hypothetical protein
MYPRIEVFQVTWSPYSNLTCESSHPFLSKNRYRGKTSLFSGVVPL